MNVSMNHEGTPLAELPVEIRRQISRLLLHLGTELTRVGAAIEGQGLDQNIKTAGDVVAMLSAIEREIDIEGINIEAWNHGSE